MILLIDNYDSFSYNLVQFIGTIQKNRYEKGLIKDSADDNYGIKVIRNDELTVEQIKALSPEYIIISPGPGRPVDAGVCEDLLKEADSNAKILGVCLGHQAICEAFGGEITYAKELMHGKQSKITFDKEEKIFEGIPEDSNVARYHSLAAKPDSIPECLQVIAKADDGEVMAVRHKNKSIYGLQFHPESVLTDYGMKMIENFLSI